jgi:hypothetical protein
MEIPDAFTPRRLALAYPTDGVLRVGHDAVFEWTPRSDRLLPDRVGLVIRRRGGAEHESFRVNASDVRIDGNRLMLKLPREIPWPSGEPVEVGFSNGMPIRVAVHCPVQKCTATVLFSLPPVVTRLYGQGG